MKLAARMGDLVIQDLPHCHAPIHPPEPLHAVPHPPCSLLIAQGSWNVLIEGKPAARVSDATVPCSMPDCTPGGPGIITKGSTKVLINDMPAARQGDMTTHPACVAPIPSPTGKIIWVGGTKVLIGG